MDEQLDRVAEAFSRKASVYDSFGAGHENLARMRAKVRRHALQYLRPGARILELNAGTGEDAVFLARRGFAVHAIDLSPGMVACIEAKARRYGLQRLTWQQLSFTQLEAVACGPFDYALSNLGGVNCLADPGRIARGLRGVLVPGAVVTLVVMPPLCLWELSQALRGRFRAAFRRLGQGGIVARVEGVGFHVDYFSPRRLARAFGPDFHPLRLQGLSVFTPTADEKEFPRRHPRLYRLLRRLDERLADLSPFSRLGDFYILSLAYRPGC